MSLAELESQDHSSTRNARARELVLPYLEGIVAYLHEAFPQLTPDHISMLGIAGTAISSGLAYEAQRRESNPLRAAALLGYLGSAITDGFDGTLARHKVAQGEEHDSDRGQLVDVVSDRIQEAILGITRMVIANQQERKAGQFAAHIATDTNPLPSLFRSIAESRGIPVSEVGENFIGFLGTRAGRLLCAVVATTYPQFKGVDVQTILDLTTASANIYTTLTRIQDLTTRESALSKEDQQRGTTRAQALALTTVAILGGSLIAHKLRTPTTPQEMRTPEVLNQHYRDTIMRLEAAGRNMLDGTHRFVGGIVPDLLEYHEEDRQIIIDTQIEYDFERRRMYLRNHKPLELMRDDGTEKDIDIIHSTSNQRASDLYNGFVDGLRRNAQEDRIPHSHVGVEGAFIPGGKKRHERLQFVTAHEVDDQRQEYLVFGVIKEVIPPQSMEDWHIVLEDGTSFTVLNPLAHYLRYYMRVPSGPKPKDLKGDKIRLLEQFAIQFGIASGDKWPQYWQAHESWFSYLNQFLDNQDVLTRIKAVGTKAYWAVGTPIAHGKGPFKPLSKLTTIFKG